MAADVTCALGDSYLILTASVPSSGPQSSNDLTQDQKVLFYESQGHDEISQYAANAPCLSIQNQPYHLINVASKAWILQDITKPNDKEEWVQKLANIFSACEEHSVQHITILQPSNGLLDNFVRIALIDVIERLERTTEGCLHVTLVAVDDKYRKDVLTVLRQRGFCPPEIESGLRISDSSLLASFLTTVKCKACKRVVQKPVMSANGEGLICAVCLEGAKLDAARFPPDYQTLVQITKEMKVTCRCGKEIARLEDFDTHTIDCDRKEYFCETHRRGGKATEFLDHLLEEHFEVIFQNLPKILNL